MHVFDKYCISWYHSTPTNTITTTTAATTTGTTIGIIL